MALISWVGSADMSAQAVVDSTPRTQSLVNLLCEIAPYGDEFGETFPTDEWRQGIGGSTSADENGGILNVKVGQDNQSLVFDLAAATNIDWAIRTRFTTLGSTTHFFAADGPPHLDAARWVADSGAIRCEKIVNGSSSFVGSFVPSLNVFFDTRIQIVGNTVTWHKKESGDSDWVIVATDTFVWDGNNKQLRVIGGPNAPAAYDVDRFYQVTAPFVYHTNAIDALTVTKVFSPSSVDPAASLIDFTGNAKLAYSFNGGAFSAYMTPAAFQALPIIPSVFSWAWKFKFNDGAERTYSAFNDISLNVTPLVGGGSPVIVKPIKTEINRRAVVRL